VAELFEDETATETLTSGASSEEEGEDDDGPARRPVFPSSLGVTVIVPPEATTLHVIARWATYKPATPEAEATAEGVERGATPPQRWTREPHEAELSLPLDAHALRKGGVLAGAGGAVVRGVIRPLREDERAQVPPKSCVVTLFLVNQRPPSRPGPTRTAPSSFKPSWRFTAPKASSRGPTGAGPARAMTSTRAWATSSTATPSRTPSAQVERVVPSEVPGCELRMDALAALESPDALGAAVTPMVTGYRAWIAQQRAVALDTDARRDLAKHLLDETYRACDRIASGLAAMDDAQVFDAFRRANRAMADAARQRSPKRYEAKGNGVQIQWRGGVGVFPILLCGPHLRPRVSL